MDCAKLETLRAIANAALKGTNPDTLILSSEEIIELLDEIDRLNAIIYQGSHMNFKDE